MKILRVVTLASKRGRYGGPFDTAKEQVDALNSKQVESTLIAGYLAGDEPDVVSTQSAVFALVRPVLPNARFAALSSAKFNVLLWKRIRSSDTVYVSFCRELIPVSAAVFSVLLRKKLVLQTHGMLVTSPALLKRILDFAIIRPLLTQADLVIALTDVEEAELIKFAGGRLANLSVVGNPVRRSFEGLARTSVQVTSDVTFIARYHARKNPAMFVRAAKVASERKLPFSFRMIGPDDGEFDKTMSEAGKLENISVEGPVSADAVPSVLRSSKLFVMCSYGEPWGNVVIGALSLGIPVIITASCALSASIASAQAGIVVDDDSSAQLVDAIEALLADEATYEEYSNRARLLADEIGNADKNNSKLMIALKDLRETVMPA